MSAGNEGEGGTRIVGRYEILREIGRGGMAIVYAARQPDLDRQVALKELSRFHSSSAEFAHRFLRESRLAGSLNHPNVVTVHEYFEHETTPYIAMELVTRGSLRPYMRRLSLAQIGGVLEGVLAGLAHAETAGIVHRDLKPENIMVTADGRVKITDFGIARATQRAGTQYMTATGMTVGTPTYMAPEQAMAGDIGPWTDLYSVGVLVYELVVGQVPFHDSEAPMVILMRHVNERIPSPIEVRPDVDPGLSRWIDSLLAKDPKDRVRHALVAWESLEDIIVHLLGPLWRRNARLLDDSAAVFGAQPLTPAPFESQGSIRTPTPPPSVVPDAFVTFDPARAPESPPAPPDTPAAPAEASPAADTPAQAPPAAEAPVAPAPPDTPSSPAAPAPQAKPEPEEFVTFGRPEPAVPAEKSPIPPDETPATASETPATASETPATASETPATATPAPEAPAPEDRASEPAPPAPAPEDPFVTFGRPVALPEPPPPRAPEPPPPEPEPEPAQAAAESPPTEPEAEPEPEPAATVPHPEPAPVLTPERESVATITADEAAPSPPPPSRPQRAPRSGAGRPAPIAILAAVIAVAAAAGGFIAAHGSSGTTTTPLALAQTASAGPISISYPSGWQRASTSQAPAAALKLSNPVALVPAQAGGGALIVGTTKTTDATLLPKGFTATLSTPPQGATVRLGSQIYLRYLDLLPQGAATPETVYALPTTNPAGTVIAACVASTTAAPVFASTCERSVSSLRLTSGSALPLTANPTFAAALGTIIAKLDASRTADTRKLQTARNQAGQATAANQLALAHNDAAQAAGKLAAGPIGADADVAIVAALRRLATAYASLANAAKRNDTRGYAAARAAISQADAALSAGFAQLRQDGYTIG